MNTNVLHYSISKDNLEPVTKRLHLVVILLSIVFSLAISDATAAKLTATYPTIDVNVSSGVSLIDPNAETKLQNDLNTKVSQAFARSMDKAQNTVGRYKSNDLAKASANSNSQLHQVASFPSFQSYDLFTLGAGFMVSGVLPAETASPDELSGMKDTLENEGDIYAGLGIGTSLFHFGFRPGGIESLREPLDLPLGPTNLNEMYLTINLGSVNIPADQMKDLASLGEDTSLAVESTIFGIGVAIPLVSKSDDRLLGLIAWRGITLNTGFSYVKNFVNAELKLNEIKNDMDTVTYDLKKPTKTDGVDAGSTTIAVDGYTTIVPKVNIQIESKTVTIPIDLMTSVQFLWLFNLGMGFGIDVNMGSSSIGQHLYGNGEFIQTGDAQYVQVDMVEKSGIDIVDSSKQGPTFVRPRLLASTGLSFGPLVIETHASYYLAKGNAFTIGLATGIVW